MGSVSNPHALSLDQLKEFPEKRLNVLMECAGNGRSYMSPKISGTPWNLGAVSQAEFTGTSLCYLLEHASLSADTEEIKFKGADKGKIPAGETENYIRSLPVDKALHPDTMIAWKMNGAELTHQHGYPLRLVVPGWYGMASVKWLKEITVLPHPYEGFFQSQEYVYSEGKDDLEQTPVTNIRVRSLITNLDSGKKVGREMTKISGIAWSGEGEIVKVAVSVNLGITWNETSLHASSSKYEAAWWEFDWSPKQVGLHTIMVRATDSSGSSQPLKSIWNKGGYGNNVVHQIQVIVE